jgi:hypothetical protein
MYKMNVLKNAIGISSPMVTVSKFGEDSSSGSDVATYTDSLNYFKQVGTTLSIVYFVVIAALLIWAFYLAHKCNVARGTTDIAQYMAACCCSPLYIILRLVSPCGK